MKRSRIWIVTVLIMIVLSVGSYSCGRGGGSAKVESTTRTTTLGQELQDLDEAHKQGIISDEEYEKKKKELLKREE